MFVQLNIYLPSRISSYPIIKRRIAWVIGKFISDQCAPAKNPRIWDVLVHLLKDRGAGTDGVVRLTAAISIQEAVDVGICLPSHCVNSWFIGRPLTLIQIPSNPTYKPR
jgi:hypothetical protein